VHVNHLPYMPFPRLAVRSEGQAANWFEAYVEAMELTTGRDRVRGGTYDESAERWTVALRGRTLRAQLHPRHVVLATA